MKFYLILLFTLFFSSTYAQGKCRDFKTGKFQNIENDIVKSEIQRTESFQMEKHGEIEVKLKIEWINECRYRLIFIEGNEAFWKSRPKDMPTPDMIVKMTVIDESSYLQESKFVIEEDFNYKSIIFKID